MRTGYSVLMKEPSSLANRQRARRGLAVLSHRWPFYGDSYRLIELTAAKCLELKVVVVVPAHLDAAFAPRCANQRR